jgi:hypothetical protein
MQPGRRTTTRRRASGSSGPKLFFSEILSVRILDARGVARVVGERDKERFQRRERCVNGRSRERLPGPRVARRREMILECARRLDMESSELATFVIVLEALDRAPGGVDRCAVASLGVSLR